VFYNFSAKNRSASKAAIQPLPADVTACRYTESFMSPAANTPSIFVIVVSGFVRIYPFASVLTKFLDY